MHFLSIKRVNYKAEALSVSSKASIEVYVVSIALWLR